MSKPEPYYGSQRSPSLLLLAPAVVVICPNLHSTNVQHHFCRSYDPALYSDDRHHHRPMDLQEQQSQQGRQAHTLSTREFSYPAQYVGGNIGRIQPQSLNVNTPQTSFAELIASPISALSVSTSSSASYLYSPYQDAGGIGYASPQSPQSPTGITLFQCTECNGQLRSRQSLKSEHSMFLNVG
ncbi:hypothetical protein J3R30DRAFT_3696248 [Lentinula aciculospora]|uniref:Uncharacterized protein n=1 Tax=Lentinula aciculospora TaxID=153920 RepID=A0A9W9ATL1_9AGAR|nr:hypothetical protein J3R30DRAFT_3696248 [Lentinula aciculospora]